MVKGRVSRNKHGRLKAAGVLAGVAALIAVAWHYGAGDSDTAAPLPSRATPPRREQTPSVRVNIPRAGSAGPRGATAGIDLSDIGERAARQRLRQDSGGLPSPALSDEVGPSVEETVRRAATAAISEAFGGRTQGSGMSRPVDRRAEMTRLFDEKALPKERRRAALFLTQDANEVELKLWSSLLADPGFPSYLKVAVVEGLGRCANPRGKDLVVQALAHSDEAVVRGAVRGLSAQGGKAATTILSDLIYSPQSSAAVKSEAVRGLGQIEGRQAMSVLVEAYNSPVFAKELALRAEVISAIGGRESTPETVDFLRGVMDNDAADKELRVAAIAALEDYPGEVGPLLRKHLSADDSDIREEAAWVLSVAEQPGDLAQEVQGLLAQEQDAGVRRRLYQALGNLENVNLPAVKRQVEQEIDPKAKISGYGLILENLNGIKDAGIQQWAKDVAIPELSNLVMTSDTVATKLEAVIALQKARTPESEAALQSIAKVTVDRQVLEALGRKTN